MLGFPRQIWRLHCGNIYINVKNLIFESQSVLQSWSYITKRESHTWRISARSCLITVQAQQHPCKLTDQGPMFSVMVSVNKRPITQLKCLEIKRRLRSRQETVFLFTIFLLKNFPTLILGGPHSKFRTAHGTNQHTYPSWTSLPIFKLILKLIYD